jgi:hypothetical protein
MEFEDLTNFDIKRNNCGCKHCTLEGKDCVDYSIGKQINKEILFCSNIVFKEGV